MDRNEKAVGRDKEKECSRAKRAPFPQCGDCFPCPSLWLHCAEKHSFVIIQCFSALKRLLLQSVSLNSALKGEH